MNYKRESSNTSSFNPKPRSTDPTARSSHEKPIVAPDPEEVDLEFPQREKNSLSSSDKSSDQDVLKRAGDLLKKMSTKGNKIL